MTDLREHLVQMTCDMVRIPSLADRPEQLQAAIDYVVAALSGLPRGSIHHFNSNNKPAIVYSLRGNKHAKLVLNAHVDVVPARPDQFEPVLKNGRIYGRGTQDMKGAAAVLIRLAQDLAKLPDPPDVNFQFVTDEEIGGRHGTNHILNEGWTCDFFITAEPTDLNICYMHKAGLSISVTMHGMPAHGSRPWLGRNPVHILRDGLVALEKRFPTPDEEAFVTTVVPVILNGGEAGNRIMETLKLQFDIRFVPEDKPDDILAGIKACFPEHATVDMHYVGVPLNTNPTHPAVQQLAGIVAEVMGQPAGFYREHFGTDARFYSAKGTAAVCCGPIGFGLHSDEEWVDIDGLVKNYQVFAKLVTHYQ